MMWHVWIDEPGGELPSAVSRLIPPPPAPPERCFPTVPVLSLRVWLPVGLRGLPFGRGRVRLKSMTHCRCVIRAPV